MRFSHPERGVRAGVARTFASLDTPNFRRWFACRLVALTGAAAAMVAQVWLLTERTGSGKVLALHTALLLLPTALGGARAGLVVDRRDARRLLVVAERIFMSIYGSLCFLSVIDVLRPWMVLFGAFVSGMVNAVASPARQAFARELAGTDRLHNAVALNGLLEMAAGVAGSGAAVFLIGPWGISPALGAGAVSSGVLLLCLGRIDDDALHRRAPVPRGPRQLRDAFRAVWADPTLCIPMAVQNLTAALAVTSVLLPVLAREAHRGANTYAALAMTMEFGSAVGALLAARTARVVPATFVVVSGALGVAQLAAAGTSFPWQWIALAGVGALWEFLLLAVNAHLMLTSPEGMSGRIVGLQNVGFRSAYLIGALLSGSLADRMTARSVIAFEGLLVLAVAVLAAVALSRARRSSSRGDAAGGPHPSAPEASG